MKKRRQSSKATEKKANCGKTSSRGRAAAAAAAKRSREGKKGNNYDFKTSVNACIIQISRSDYHRSPVTHHEAQRKRVRDGEEER